MAGRSTAAGGGGFYFMAFIGTAVFFWQQASEFWGYVLAVLKALVWPAFLLYEVFQALD